MLLGVLLVAAPAAGPGQAQKKVQIVQRRMHRLYVPRDQIRPSAKTLRIAAKSVPALPLAARLRAKLPEVKRLQDHWRRLAVGQAPVDRVRQSLRTPDEGSLARPKMRNDRWFEVPGGMNDPYERRHRGGRVRGLAYAYDSSLGREVLWIGTSGGGSGRASPGRSGAGRR
ncbi:MAG: hypothetical protein MZU91_10665 [Desulfosudis oleivorans]|nr:hypothetical protein [Desulfosudis oleivorans]